MRSTRRAASRPDPPFPQRLGRSFGRIVGSRDRGVVPVMTVHKLSAGDGYTYLTRQVASADERRSPGQSLADYYVARGNPPGQWLGGGARHLELEAGEVTESQM